MVWYGMFSNYSIICIHFSLVFDTVGLWVDTDVLEEELPALHASGLMNFSGCVDAVMSAMMMDAPGSYKVSLSTYTSTQWKPEVCCLYSAYCESLETNIICHLEHKCEMKVFYMRYGC